jgi:hypothetical protein
MCEGQEEDSRVYSRQPGVSVYCVMAVLAFTKTGLRPECLLSAFVTDSWMCVYERERERERVAYVLFCLKVSGRNSAHETL